jgi:hypothetical protein
MPEISMVKSGWTFASSIFIDILAINFSVGQRFQARQTMNSRLAAIP